MATIYLDSCATTPMLPEVWEAMRPFLTEIYGNPSSAHGAGRRARLALEDAREQTAGLLEARADEVIFTSGATESNNLAIFGLAGKPPGQMIASPIEHPCVSEPLHRLEQDGLHMGWLPVDALGIVKADLLPPLLGPETRLVCVQLANHETGALQPVGDLVQLLGDRAPLHCDAAQAVGKVPVHFYNLGAATLSFSAHKFHGPKGIGGLLVRRGVRLRPLLWGGHQQQGRRPGTEPVALVVGLAKALELACRERASRAEHVLHLRQRFLERLQSDAAPVVINGADHHGLPHVLNLSFPGCQAEALLMNLDLAGVACSTGSACSSGSLLPSPVLQAMQVPEDRLRSAMRFSFSHLLGLEEIDEAARRIAAAVGRLRGIGDP